MPRDNNQNQQFQALSQDEVKEVAGAGRWVTLGSNDLGGEAWGTGVVMSYTIIRRYYID